MHCANCRCSLNNVEAFPVGSGDFLCERCDSRLQRWEEENYDMLAEQERYQRFMEEC